ncbi:MFS transporter [Halobacillus shinanisalinarum]|uniref:MFS transporter n=1 Tax=Halobacillus shinanisalinarum TaxID=2932258 RepID=A0ABY4H153_9BACI|nr:MFS transporter [Halobacillus shinanisalinarum]UOQ93903.1 MFS transporter [Halobacillus shinanisalinarum]
MQETYKGNKQILFLSTLAFFVSVMVWFNMAPFNSTIMEQLGLTKEEVGVLMLVNLALAIPARIVMGQLVDRFGPKKVFSLLLVVMSIPCFTFALANSYWQLLISRLLLGIIGASFVVGIRMIAEWFPQNKSGFMHGIYAGWGNFGSALASFTLPLIALWVGEENGWRYAIAMTGVISLIYGFIYYRSVEDAPPMKEFKRSKSAKGMKATSFVDLIILVAAYFPIYGGLAVLIWSLQRTSLLTLEWAIGLYVLLGVLYMHRAVKIALENRAYLMTEIPIPEKYSMKQVAVLSLAYFSAFGAELAVISMLPMFFQETYALGSIGAGMIASSFAFTNLIARPAGGWMSDQFGRKKVLMILLFLLSILYFGMSFLSGHWPLALAVLLTMSCSMVGQAASGSVFSMVPFIKKNNTGQIAGMVGAYGNIGSVCFLAVLNLMYPAAFFSVIGAGAFLCFIFSCFIKEPSLHALERQKVSRGA